ncbi:MAG: hypothetical protein FWG87_13100 [Defluviitaleaceae bacterium]|nr:hypothetical protein [Defluviitaleaceae bacterium]
MKEKFEGLLEQGKSYIESGKQNEGLALIKEGLAGLKDEVSFGHCFEIGMVLTAVKDSNGYRIPEWQRLSVWLLQKAVDNKTGIEFLEANGQQQVVEMLRRMLNAAKGELQAREKIEDIYQNVMDFLNRA